MNWDQIQVNWTQFKGEVRNNWVKLTDEDITRIAGRRSELRRAVCCGAFMASPRPRSRARDRGPRTKAQRHAA